MASSLHRWEDADFAIDDYDEYGNPNRYLEDSTMERKILNARSGAVRFAPTGGDSDPDKDNKRVLVEDPFLSDPHRGVEELYTESPLVMGCIKRVHGEIEKLVA